MSYRTVFAVLQCNTALHTLVLHLPETVQYYSVLYCTVISMEYSTVKSERGKRRGVLRASLCLTK